MHDGRQDPPRCQAPNVWVLRDGRCYCTTLVLTNYHLCFDSGEACERVDIPLIAYAVRRPTVLRGGTNEALYPISLFLETFEHMALGFTEEALALSVMEQMKQAAHKGMWNMIDPQNAWSSIMPFIKMHRHRRGGIYTMHRASLSDRVSVLFRKRGASLWSMPTTTYVQRRLTLVDTHISHHPCGSR